MQQDIERWNKKFAAGDGAVELQGEPELVALKQYLSCEGRALEVACGKGANALYLASLGYQVIAADGSIEALKICSATATRLNLDVTPVQMDFDDCELGEEKYNLISVIRYLNRDLFPALIAALAPNGILFYKTFNQNKENFNRDYLLNRGELINAFKNLELITHSEDADSSYLLARKN